VGIDPDGFSGVVVDGDQVVLDGEWVESTSLRPFVGSSYYHDGNGGKGMTQRIKHRHAQQFESAEEHQA